jgi:UDP-3-O-[3-hydroxymyristoyl] glucosamine N-acyltransferase
MKLADVAGVVGGTAYGDIEFEINNILPPEEAQESDLTFLFDERPQTNAGVIISHSKVAGKSGIIVEDMKDAMFCLLRELSKTQRTAGISPQAVLEAGVQLPESCTVEPFAVIKKNARIGSGTYIGAHCYIDEGVVIGENCEIHPSTVICRGTKIGSFSMINSSAVIGKEGFGYVKRKRYEKVRHIGGVVVGDFVEIGSGVTIDRATIGNTIVGEGTKIDNQVHIAHNVKIGRNCIIMGQAGIAGSSRVGDNVILCGQVGISDHLQIEDNVIVYAKSGVFKPLKEGRKYSGNPAREHDAVLRAMARLYRNCEVRKHSG